MSIAHGGAAPLELVDWSDHRVARAVAVGPRQEIYVAVEDGDGMVTIVELVERGKE
jgi:hypothetical protein